LQDPAVSSHQLQTLQQSLETICTLLATVVSEDHRALQRDPELGPSEPLPTALQLIRLRLRRMATAAAEHLGRAAASSDGDGLTAASAAAELAAAEHSHALTAAHADGFGAIAQLPAEEALDAIKRRLEGLAGGRQQVCDHSCGSSLPTLHLYCSRCQRYTPGSCLQVPSMHDLMYGAASSTAASGGKALLGARGQAAAASPRGAVGTAAAAAGGPVLESPKRWALERKMQLWQLKRSMARNMAVGG
jgi:hypothetical protein